MRANFVLVGAAFAFFLTSPVQAQVTLDASKVTCDQFVHSKIGLHTRTIAVWLSGFYHGQRNNPVIDPQGFEDNVTKLVNFCSKQENFKVLVMQAIDHAIGSTKK
jgi:hypothetical protein